MLLWLESVKAVHSNAVINVINNCIEKREGPFFLFFPVVKLHKTHIFKFKKIHFLHMYIHFYNVRRLPTRDTVERYHIKH